MKNLLKVIPVLIFTAIGVFAFSMNFNPEIKAEPAISADPANSVAPRDLYMRNCARCHGADGKSQNELGQTLDAPDLTARKAGKKRIISIITNGEGAMPGFGKKLKKTEISALAAYVRSL